VKETRECHNCHKVGHIARDCWHGEARNQRPRGGSNRGRGAGRRGGGRGGRFGTNGGGNDRAPLAAQADAMVVYQPEPAPNPVRPELDFARGY
jgi:hypothetical protein